MNANQIVNMIIRTVMRKAINGGINAGMKKFSGARSPQPAPQAQQPAPHPQATQAPPPPQAPPAPPAAAELTPERAKIERKLAAKRAARAAEAAGRHNSG